MISALCDKIFKTSLYLKILSMNKFFILCFKCAFLFLTYIVKLPMHTVSATMKESFH